MKNPQIKQILTILKERDRLYTQRFDSMDKANVLALNNAKEQTSIALASAKEAVNKADIANEKRLDSMNEFRGQQKDMINTLITRNEVDIRFKSLEEKLTIIQNNQNLNKGHSQGVNWLWGILIGVLGIAVGVYSGLH